MKRLLLFAAALLLGNAMLNAQSIIYVDSAATGSNDGSSWASAYTNLQSALGVAQAGSNIYVAKGTYQPATSGSYFSLMNNVAVYGGFPTGGGTLALRDWKHNKTILQGNDTSVIRNTNLDKSAVLDGFTITGGRAYNGGGIYDSIASPTITNCIFSGDSATDTRNSGLTGNGGGMYNTAGSSPLITNCVFACAPPGIAEEGLSAYNGGAMYNNASSPTIINTLFVNNWADYNGGAIYNAGSSPSLINCTLVQDWAEYGGYGGAMYDTLSSAPVVTNSIIWASGSSFAPGIPIYNDPSRASTVTYSLIQQANADAQNHNLDGNALPMFANPDAGIEFEGYNYDIIAAGPDGIYGTADDGLIPLNGSALLNAGNPDTTGLHLPATDLAGNARIYGNTIDIGAYEYQAPVTPDAGGVLYVDNSNTNALSDGSNWTNALPSLSKALAAADTSTVIKQIWVAKGTYLPATDSSFHMAAGVAIYGGFTGSETSLSQRNPKKNITILKGNGAGVIGNTNLDSTSVLDGFTVTGGTGRNGAGMINNAASPAITGCIFYNNTTVNGGGGGAVYNENASSPRITDCIFHDNAASGGEGGAIENVTNSAPVFINSIFYNNTAFAGGAIGSVNTAPELINCTLYNNTATGQDGGEGGAIYYLLYSPIISNSIIYGNSSGIYASASSGTPQYTYSLIQGMSGEGTGDIDGGTDPMFVNPAADSLELKAGSPAINAGNNDSLPSNITTDLAGGLRLVNTVDMGAYEYLTPVTPDAHGIVYVNAAKGAYLSGSNWANALDSLNTALAAAATDTSIKQIWVAAGTYSPEQDSSFHMVTGVKIYGGFTGNETTLSQRNPKFNQSLLTSGGYYDANLISNRNIDTTAVLDGFTITGTGKGAMYNNHASPVIIGCTFTGTIANYPDNKGGAMWNDTASAPHITGCSFTNNSAFGSSGGAMYNSYSAPVIMDCSFTGNQVQGGFGGAMSNDTASPVLINCIFTGNQALGNGGGAIYNLASSPRIINNTIVSNTVNAAPNTGGGIYNIAASSPVITNSIIYGNTINGTADNIDNSDAASIPVIMYSMVQGQDGTEGAGDIDGTGTDVTSIFNDPANNDYTLIAGSPAIDKGNNDSIPAGITTDLAGNARIFNNVVDMGAYEAVNVTVTPDANGIVYVNGTAAEITANNGSSWSNALFSLGAALKAAVTNTGIQQIWVAKGTYTPAKDSSFHMVSGVKIYGGFAGTETTLSQRVIPTNGGISGSGSILKGNGGSVIINDGIDNTALLDGFTITGGTGSDIYNEGVLFGGGIVNIDAAAPIISNCIITGNSAMLGGGGVFNYTSMPVFINCIISDNTATPYITGGYDGYGGGIENEGDAIFTAINCVIAGNNDQNNYNNGGGGTLDNYQSTATLTNCTITGNTANGNPGGGIYNEGGGSVLTLANTILYGNESGITDDGSSGNVTTITYSDIQGGYTGTGNIDAAPLFIDSVHSSFELASASPAINAGNNDSIPSGDTTDLAGNARIYDNIIDMGAYEQHILGNTVTNNGSAQLSGLNGSINITGTSISSDINALIYQWQLAATPDNGSSASALLVNPADYSAYAQLLAAAGVTLDNNDFIVADVSKLPALVHILSPEADTMYWHNFTGTISVSRIVGPDPTPDSSISNAVNIQIQAMALPVTIQSFTGTLQNGIADLQWHTGVEANFNHFELEKSAGIASEAQAWQSLATIAAKGSNSTYIYSAAQSEPTAYYRLKMVDNDGNAMYGNVVTLSQNGTAGIQLYPNPAKDYINISVQNAGNISIYNAAGALVKTQALQQGVNVIDIQALGTGVYYGIIGNNKVKFIKE